MPKLKRRKRTRAVKPADSATPAQDKKPVHGTNPGDKVSGDRLVVRCQKHGRWELIQKSRQHRGYQTVAKKDATAIVEQRYTNI